MRGVGRIGKVLIKAGVPTELADPVCFRDESEETAFAIKAPRPLSRQVANGYLQTL